MIRQRLFPGAQAADVARRYRHRRHPRLRRYRRTLSPHPSPVLSIPAVSFSSTPTCANASNAAVQPLTASAALYPPRVPPSTSSLCLSAVSTIRSWPVAASVVLVTGAVAYWGVYEFPALHGGPRATVEQIDGALYRVSGGSLVLMATGAQLNENDTIRTAKNSTAILRLNDGSKVEMNQRAQVYVTRSWTGSTVHLALGSVIVAAAKQRQGTLQVTTADCDVSVKGTIFSVNAGIKGSRVAVVEGTVWVDHGSQHDVLHKGDQTTTAPDMTPAPIAQEFSWSRNSAQYMNLLSDLAAVNHQIDAIPATGLRYQSKLMAYLPADTIAVAAIPNIGNTLADADARSSGRSSPRTPPPPPPPPGALSQWWNHLPAAQRTNFETVMQQLTTGSQYLGNEIVVYIEGLKSSPVVIAEETSPSVCGLTSRARFPPT